MRKITLGLVLASITIFSFAKTDYPIGKHSLKEAENYKIEKAMPEQDAQRSVAGDRIKKKTKSEEYLPSPEKSRDGDSEVRHWKYSEE